MSQRPRPGIAGPLILIFLGVIFLLNNIGVVDWTVWDVIQRFWPVLLIAAGLDLMLARRSAWGSIIALVLILVFIAVSIGAIDQPPPSYAGLIQVSVPAGRAQREEIRLNPAVGYLRVAGSTDAAGDALHGQIRPFRGEQVEQTEQTIGGRVTARVVSQSWVVFPFITIEFGRPNWDLTVDPGLSLVLETELAVGRSELNLSNSQLEKLTVSTSVGQTLITLPATSAEVRIEGGVGQIEVNLPAGVGASLRADIGIGSTDLPAGFTKIDGVYYSPGYEQAAEKLDIVLDLGVGVIRVR